MTRKDAGLLALAAAGPGSGLYPGIQWDFAPRRFTKLSNLGLVERYTPHNPVHKERAVITQAGREALKVYGDPFPKGA